MRNRSTSTRTASDNDSLEDDALFRDDVADTPPPRDDVADISPPRDDVANTPPPRDDAPLPQTAPTTTAPDASAITSPLRPTNVDATSPDGFEDGIDPHTRTPTVGEALTLLGMFLTELPTYCVYLLFHRTHLLVSVGILFLVIGILLHTLLDTSDAGARVGKAVRGRTKWV